MTTKNHLVPLLAASLLAACAAPVPAPSEAETDLPPGVADPGALRDHGALMAILWQQTSAEYEANARGIYGAASDQLDAALADPDRDALAHESAPPETGPERPPAVILDVDETVLDNSPYQARLVQDGAVFDSESWQTWCEERRAPAVPGALEFTRLAAERGVRVFYVTNRDHAVEEPTRDNLRALGFPVAAAEDVVLTRGEREDWGSSKTVRRAHVAARYRVIMLFGDNLGDFLSPYRTSLQARAAQVEKHAARWGRDWFMLPNPLYGSWESALFDHDYGRPAEERRDARYGALRTDR